MKTLKTRQVYVLVAVLTSVCSCVNRIPNSDLVDGMIPINISTTVHLQKTRVISDEFEENDAIGLYVLPENETLDGSRHAENIKYTYSQEGFTPETMIYYPDDVETCNFIGYYPYKKKAVNAGATTIDVTVKTNQAEKSGFSSSDFLVATAKDITPSYNPVHLSFNHKLYRMNIRLKPSESFTVNQLLAAQPKIVFSDLYTKASYDFKQDKFTNYSAPADIIPYGEWKKEGDMLIGKSVNIIPQTLRGDHTIMELEIEGRTFQMVLSNYALTSGSAENYTINISERISATITADINGWNTSEQVGDASETNTTPYIDISKLNFAKSWTYNIIHDGNQVALLCKEYLKAVNIDKQAIVVYPMKDGKADLSKGTVLRILDENAKLHGGEVSWNKSNNSLTYKAGSSEPIDIIYISADLKIMTTRPEKTLPLEAKEYMLSDTRGNELKVYPIIKIGTQYWMGSNLEATKYTDGSSITLKENFADNSPGYCTPDDDNIFYNIDVINSGLVAPAGWRVSTENDWELLKKYVNNNAAVLKKGTEWNQTGQAKPSNLTGFNAVVTGLYNNTYNNNIYAGFWYMSDNEPSKAVSSYGLSSGREGTNNEINKNSTPSPNVGTSIRCVMK